MSLFREKLKRGWRVKIRKGFQEARVRRTAGWVRVGLAMVLVFYLTGCALGPDFVRPKPPPVDRYDQGVEPSTTVQAEGQAQYFEKGGSVAEKWWVLFHSLKLNEVMTVALSNNPTLQGAQASLRQSQYILRAGYGVFFPQFDGSFDAARQQFSPARIGSNAPSTIFNLYTLSATVSYPLDFFGGERRLIENLQAKTDFQRYSVAATYLTLSGNLVNTMIAQAAYSAQIEATEEMVRLLKEQVRLAEVQAKAGTVSYSNVLSIRSQLALTEATLPPLRQKLSQTEHLLATLAGRTPAEWVPPQIKLEDLSLPTQLPVTLPSELVHQRPDILAAEAQLHSASAEVGISTAALFPSISLNGTYGVNNTSISNLFQNTSSFWSFGGNLTAPLFHGGSLWFQRKAAMEGFQQSLASYRQTVLGGFAQVADTLRSLEHDAETLDAQARALDAAEQALRLVQANYQAGLVNYLQIITVNDQYQTAKIGYLQVRAQRLQDTVALFVALGGGWQTADKKILNER